MSDAKRPSLGKVTATIIKALVSGFEADAAKENMDDLGCCSEKCRDKVIRVEIKKDDND
jgi:hypothetical protein